jgi:hypothetical protein
VTIANGSIATFDDGTTQTSKVLTPGQSATFTVVGVAPGTTGYTISEVDSLDYPYNGSATITVGNPYSVTSPVNMKVGDKQSVTVTRVSGAARGAATLNITPANSTSTGIATVDVKTIMFQAGETVKTINVTGVSAGAATYNLVDPSTGASATLIINVTAATTGCTFQNGQGNLQFVVFQDLKTSAQFVALSTGMLRMMRSGTMVSVTGDRAQLVPATGAFNASTCSFDITGVSTAPIASVSNVHCEYNLTIDPVKNTVSGKYSVGTMGDLFGEPPVIYNVTGAFTPF